MARARTLVEANLYVTIERGAVTTSLREGQDAWTVLADDSLEVEVPYSSEAEAREERARFGVGLSELIDAGQWVLIASEYARRAIADEPILNWEYARDALSEALKFLPPGVDEMPAGAFWTPDGRAAYFEEPAFFTRARLEQELALYTESP